MSGGVINWVPEQRALCAGVACGSHTCFDTHAILNELPLPLPGERSLVAAPRSAHVNNTKNKAEVNVEQKKMEKIQGRREKCSNCSQRQALIVFQRKVTRE